MTLRTCWCGSTEHLEFSSEYNRCAACGTLVSSVGLSDVELTVADDDSDFYGKKYWLEHQNKDLGFPDIFQRAKTDLTDRNLHWLRTLLKYKVPPSKILEMGCSHGSFVALLQQAGYDASGMEMSPWVVDFAKETFDIPVLVGPVEHMALDAGSFDVVALMDVLEHLPDPVSTMSHALRLLKPNGILLVQTPQAKDEMTYAALVETNAPFLEQFKSDEHLYLFTQRSVTTLFERLGAKFIQFELPIFHEYDMFFAVSMQPIVLLSQDEAHKAMETPKGRIVQALIDLKKRIEQLEADIGSVSAEAEQRLDQINTLTKLIHDARAAEQKID